MTTTTIPTTSISTITTEPATRRTDRRRSLWLTGAASGVAAAAATTLIVVAARAADISVSVQGQQIPLFGFAQLTLVGAVIGVVLAKALARWARRPRHTFVATTVALTALSLVPDAIVDATAASKVVLMLTHVVAATIIVPRVAIRLRNA